MNLPLLIQGFLPLSVATLTQDEQRNTITQNRGRATALDLVTAQKIGDLSDALVTATVGGMEIVDNDSLENYQVEAYQGRFKRLQSDYKGGQSIGVSINNQSLVTAAVSLHVLYENKYANDLWRTLVYDNSLNLKRSIFSSSLAAGAKVAGTKFVLPTNRGQIVAVEPIALGANVVVMGSVDISVRANGITIMQEMQLSACSILSSRNNLFPIHIANAGSLELTVNNTGTNPIVAGVRVYYAPDELVKPILNEMDC